MIMPTRSSWGSGEHAPSSRLGAVYPRLQPYKMVPDKKKQISMCCPCIQKFVYFNDLRELTFELVNFTFQAVRKIYHENLRSFIDVTKLDT
jgi:hypothetical protein